MTGNVTPTPGWEILFKQLLPNDAPDFTIDQSGNTVQFICDDPADALTLSELLSTALRSPEGLHANLAYTLGKSADAISLPDYDETIPTSPNDGSDNLVLLETLLGKDTKLAPGVFARWSDLFDISQANAVLLSAEAVNEDDKQFWESASKKLIQRLVDTPLYKLRQCFAAAGVPLPEKSSAGENAPYHFIARDLLAKCFGLTDVDGKLYQFFDAGLLHKLLYPPRIAVGDDLGNCQITVSKEALIAYLKQVFDEGFVLNLTDEAGSAAQPVLLPNPARSRAISGTHVNLILDNSASMTDVRSEYLRQITQFLDSLEATFRPDDKLSITLFGDNVQTTAFTFRTLSEAKHHVTLRLGCNQRTALYNAICERITAIQAPNATQNTDNTVFVLLTDGDDNGGDYIFGNRCKLFDVSQGFASATVKPKIFTLGLGGNYNNTVCRNIASSTGGEHVHLKTLSDFNGVYEHLERIKMPRTVVEFLQQGLATQFFHVFDNPVQVPTAVKPGTAFTVNGHQYAFSHGRPQTQPGESREEAGPATNKHSLWAKPVGTDESASAKTPRHVRRHSTGL